MARTSFSRTLVKTRCKVRYVDENNKVREADITLFGDYNMDNVHGPAKRMLNAKAATVEEISHTSYYGTITYEQFDEIATKTNFKEW